MASFKGTYQHILDPKSRFNIPSKMRSGFVPEDQDTAVLTRGFDQCVHVYSLSEWRRLEDTLRRQSIMDTEVRKLIRVLSGNAHECELDKQGRVLIPQTLLTYAGLTKDILVVGMLNWIEVWNPEVYERVHKGFDLEKTAELKMKL